MALFRKQNVNGSFKSSSTTKIHYSRQQLKLHPGAITDFVWKDYSSDIFSEIHELRKIRYEEYMSLVCCHDIIVKLIASRSIDRPFYCFTHDNRFAIKTLQKSEAKLLMEMLPSYNEYLKTHETSLLSKFCGLHAARPASGGPKVHFVVVENVLDTELRLDLKYDLKGTSKGRTPSQMELIPDSTLLKDSDLNLCFYFDPPIRTQLLEQIRLDFKFLEERGLMNYSVLIGVHIECKETENGRRSSESGINFGSEIAARAIRITRSETESTSKGIKPIVEKEESMKVYVFLGVVDILQSYNVVKRFEHMYKSLHRDSNTISCVRPQLYSNRLHDFLSKVFLSEEDQSLSQTDTTDS